MNLLKKPKSGDRVEILEDGYCGIEFARVGAVATVVSPGAALSSLWVKFDAQIETDPTLYPAYIILTEHNGIGWKLLENTCI